WLHRSCLDRWRVADRDLKEFTQCGACHFDYVLTLDRTHSESREQLRAERACKLALCNFSWVFVLLQVWLLSFALLLRLFDQEEVLVKFFSLPQDPGTPMPGSGSFLNAIGHHKETYYLSSILLSLCLLGFAGAYTWVTFHSQGQAEIANTPQPPNPSNRQAAQPVGTCGQCIASCIVTPGLTGCSCSSFCSTLLGFVALVVVAFIVAGLFIALVALVGAMLKVIQGLAKLQERTDLARKYVVTDLADFNHTEQLIMNQDLRASLELDIIADFGRASWLGALASWLGALASLLGALAS
ncbi:unnamed protein product, partial [Polarella glacialis]